MTQPESDHAGARPTIPLRALIVEDDVLQAMLLAEMLKDMGTKQVSVCPSIASALAELERLHPDLLVLDVHLADRDDGWAMAELVRELTPEPPTIIFSTATPELIPPQIAELGRVLEKPFTVEELRDALTTHTEKPSFLHRLRKALGN